MSESQIQMINDKICPLFLGEKWFHNFIKKKYHKQYKTKNDAFNSYKRTVTDFKIDLVHDFNELQLVKFTLIGNSFGYS